MTTESDAAGGSAVIESLARARVEIAREQEIRRRTPRLMLIAAWVCFGVALGYWTHWTAGVVLLGVALVALATVKSAAAREIERQQPTGTGESRA